MIVKQGEITQLNKDGARLVAEAGVATKRVRELETRGELAQLELDQTRSDRTRMEAERDALPATVQAQADELAAARTERENSIGELAKLSAPLEAQEVMLTDYRKQLGMAGPAA